MRGADSPGDRANFRRRCPCGTDGRMRHTRLSPPGSQMGRNPEGPSCRRSGYNCGMTCAQTANMPTNKMIEANAAASSTKILNITAPMGKKNIHRTLFCICSFVKRGR